MIPYITESKKNSVRKNTYTNMGLFYNMSNKVTTKSNKVKHKLFYAYIIRKNIFVTIFCYVLMCPYLCRAEKIKSRIRTTFYYGSIK